MLFKKIINKQEWMRLDAFILIPSLFVLFFHLPLFPSPIVPRGWSERLASVLLLNVFCCAYCSAEQSRSVCVCVCSYTNVCLCVSAGQTGNVPASAAATPHCKRREDRAGTKQRARKQEVEYGPRQIKPWGPGVGWPLALYKYAGLLPIRVWCLELCNSTRTSPAQENLIHTQAFSHATSGRRPQTGL